MSKVPPEKWERPSSPSFATVTANSAGQITTQMTVIKGPFGANHIVCGSTQSCLVSVERKPGNRLGPITLLSESL